MRSERGGGGGVSTITGRCACAVVGSVSAPPTESSEAAPMAKVIATFFMGVPS
jgi:hypothetical protein